MLFNSRGFKEAAATKGSELEAALLKASDNGKIPIVCDTSPCLAQIKQSLSDPALRCGSELALRFILAGWVRRPATRLEGGGLLLECAGILLQGFRPFEFRRTRRKAVRVLRVDGGRADADSPAACLACAGLIVIARACRALSTRRFALYEPVEFIRHFLLDKLEFRKVRDSVAIHVPCSSKKMGIEDAFTRIAEMCAHEVTASGIPCCGARAELLSHPSRT
jgi:hypothetical protein